MKKQIAAMVITTMLVSQFSLVYGKGLLGQDVNKALKEPAAAEKELQAEQELEEEKQSLLAEQERYSNRYLIRYGQEHLSGDILENNVRQIFTKAKAQKVKKEEAVKNKIKDAKEKLEFAGQLEAGVAEPVERDIAQVEIGSTSNGYDIIYLPEKVDSEVFIEEIQKSAGGGSIYIQPDYVVELAAAPETGMGVLQEGGRQQNSVYRGRQEEPVREPEEPEEEISVPQGNILDREEDLQEAWKRSKGAGVKVALLDTGVDTSHPDLVGHVMEGYDFVNGREGAYDAELGMEQAHGTHIAGIIASAAPEATILPLKVFQRGSAYTSDILEAIAFAEEQGVSVVNMSFGGCGKNQALLEAMEGSGMFFVCAVGNHRKDLVDTPIYPASFSLENSISVAALNQDLGLAYFSNYGETADIAAWGCDVYSCFPEGEHGVLDGTSMAAGYVSAAAALAISGSAKGGLKERLKSTADRITCLDGKIAQGNKLSFSGAVFGSVKEEMAVVEPKEDYATICETMSPKEQMELFEAGHNIAIAAGDKHALVVKEDGTVWSWGTNELGGLGDLEAKTKSYSPVLLLLGGAVTVSAGSNHNIALCKNGKMYTWGYNGNGQLGNGTTNTYNIPSPVTIASGYGRIKWVSAGNDHCLAVTENGKVLAWGLNRYGQLGNGTYTNALTPVEIAGLSNIVEVSAGDNQSMALDQNGDVWVWGKNVPGHVGDGTASTVPVKLNLEYKIKKLSTGMGRNNAVLTSEHGAVWSWGMGNLGEGQLDSTVTQFPQYVYGSNKVEFQKMDEISIGYKNSLALRQNGTVWGWGENAYGELGNGTTAGISSATKIHSDVKAVSSGTHFSMMLKTDGTIVVAGDNTYGQCGKPESIKKCIVPVEVTFSNFSISTALPMQLNQPVYGEISKLDICYYFFKAPESGTYTFESISSFNLCGVLSDSEGNQLEYNNDGEGMGESTNRQDFYIKQHLQGGQTYYLRIYSFRNLPAGSYMLKVKLGDDCGNDIEHAKLIEEGTTNGRIDYFLDNDMYRFVPKKTGYYEMKSNSIRGVLGKLYDSDGTEPYILEGNMGLTENPSDFFRRLKLLANKTYYIDIMVGRYTQTLDEYTLTVQYHNDHSNETFEAEEIYMGDSVNCEIEYGGDIDVFQFTPKKTAIYVFESVSNFDTYGILYDKSGKQISYNDDGKGVGESTNRLDFYIKYPLAANTTYYIAAKAYSSTKTGTLVLKVKESIDDYGGQTSSAHDISETYLAEGEINYIGDTDAFVYIPKTDGAYILSTMGDTHLDGVLLIVDGNLNTTSKSPVYVGNNIKFEVNMKAGEKHYMMLYNKDTSVSSLGTYKVYVEKRL